MAVIQKIVTILLPKSWAEAIKAESESWLLRCSHCGDERTVWQAGGVRYKAASRNKRVGVYCPNCGQVRMMSLERSDEPTVTKSEKGAG